MGETMKSVRATYAGQSGLWHGAIKMSGKVVWKCGHNHHNRDHGSKTWGRSACSCAQSALRFALMNDAELERTKADLRAYMSGSSMSPRMAVSHDYELSVRDEIRRAIGL
jgi:hypothetical protein